MSFCLDPPHLIWEEGRGGGRDAGGLDGGGGRSVGGVRSSDTTAATAAAAGGESEGLAKPEERRDGSPPVFLSCGSGEPGATGPGAPASGSGRRGGLSPPLSRCPETDSGRGTGLRGATGEQTALEAFEETPLPPPTRSDDTPPFFQVALGGCDGKGDAPLLRDPVTRAGARGAGPSS